MSITQVSVQRPRRWDAPLDPQMSAEKVDRLMAIAPFCSMDENAFTRNLPLRDILRNDCRISDFEQGDIVIRQGDYGNSVFLVLEGSLLVTLARLPDEFQGRAETRQKSWWQSLAQLWTNSTVAEARSLTGHDMRPNTRTHDEETRVFIQDIPGVVNMRQTVTIGPGQLFGEIAALTRTPRSATVIANGPVVLLEMRWQGFRDILKRDQALREYVDVLYRKNSLLGHLEHTPELRGLPAEVYQNLVAVTRFESFGNFEWNQKFSKLDRKDVAERIQSEPLIAEEGSPANDLILIRNGFARLSRTHGDGHRTVAYLGKGQSFGMREVTHNCLTGENRGYSLSLRAVGYVDVLRIPADALQREVLPNLPSERLPPPMPALEPSPGQQPQRERRLKGRDQEIETGLLEFLVENRFINGTQAMLIDLDRCTRCDDCVRACAATHDNNPRFVRQGLQHENWMVAGACMHCIDPVCMIGCPTGAIGRDETTGNVVINDQTCIGCGTCATSCPYDNIRMVDIRDGKGNPVVDESSAKPVQKATKCDFCAEQAGGPACQRACPHDALYRVNLTTPLPLIQLTHNEVTT